MADRRSVLQNEEVLTLAAQFTCAADEVWRLQRGSDEDCILFQHWANKGERITDRGSRQGFWVFSPSGTLLGRINTRNAAKVTGMLKVALAKFERLTPEELKPAEVVATSHRWEDGYPEGGLVLERYSRDLDEEGQPRPLWNRDTLWFSAEETAGMVEELDFSLLAGRMARFSLVDDPRGQTLPYAPSEVRTAQLEAKVVERSEDRVVLELTGQTEASSDGAWELGENLWKPKKGFPHAMVCTLEGRAVIEQGSITGFELVAHGQHSGRTQFNGRSKDSSPGRIAFHFSLAPENLRLAPAFSAMYGVDWIPRPKVPTWRLSPSECGLEED